MYSLKHNSSSLNIVNALEAITIIRCKAFPLPQKKNTSDFWEDFGGTPGIIQVLVLTFTITCEGLWGNTWELGMKPMIAAYKTNALPSVLSLYTKQ